MCMPLRLLPCLNSTLCTATRHPHHSHTNPTRHGQCLVVLHVGGLARPCALVVHHAVF